MNPYFWFTNSDVDSAKSFVVYDAEVTLPTDSYCWGCGLFISGIVLVKDSLARKDTTHVFFLLGSQHHFVVLWGIKPTYGRVSRFGLMAYASSLDVIGCFSSVADTAILLEAISGHDIFDATSSERSSSQLIFVNSYFQRKGQGPGTCDFSGAAIIIAIDPSSGTCTFPSSRRFCRELLQILEPPENRTELNNSSELDRGRTGLGD
ncbi:hypothetical protein IFM89_006811 [Coptis chinensis]|uniref:X8 domain-containing protein n=1 Tax=Coptis chinensis TaxID=261450 RepID=A0A835M798_9MAGN|nr:hypothetical protein IFM89_006811 [Coptis chinensis]